MEKRCEKCRQEKKTGKDIFGGFRAVFSRDAFIGSTKCELRTVNGHRARVQEKRGRTRRFAELTRRKPRRLHFTGTVVTTVVVERVFPCRNGV